MNKIARTLTMAGLGVLAGISFGAPALAGDSAAGKSGGVQVQSHGDRSYVQGFYRTLGACKKTGAVGAWAGRWDNPRCYPVRVGFRRGMWMLKVERQHRHGHVIIGRDRGQFHVGNLQGGFHGHDRRDFRGNDRRDFRGNDFGGHDRRNLCDQNRRDFGDQNGRDFGDQNRRDIRIGDLTGKNNGGDYRGNDRKDYQAGK